MPRTVSRGKLAVCDVLRSQTGCPLMAQSGHHDRAERCPLSGVKRTLQTRPVMSAFDPKRTLGRSRNRRWGVKVEGLFPRLTQFSVRAEWSCKIEARPVQRTQAKPCPGWRIARARSHPKLGAPIRSILQPISDSRRLSPSVPRPTLQIWGHGGWVKQVRRHNAP